MLVIRIKRLSHQKLWLSLRTGIFTLFVLFNCEERGDQFLKLPFLLLLSLLFDYAQEVVIYLGLLLPPAATLGTWLEREILNKRRLSLALIN